MGSFSDRQPPRLHAISSGIFDWALVALFLTFVCLTGYLQTMKLVEAPSLRLGVLSLILVGTPIAAYRFYLDVRAAGRPITAGLMHAVAIFSALVTLAVADLGDPLALALGEPHEHSTVASPPSPPVGVAHQVSGAGAPKVLAPAVPPTPPAVEVHPWTRAAAVGDPTYSLYDMLSLIGMIATITLIIFGALVPEESRMLERRRDARQRALAALTAYASAITTFRQRSQVDTADDALALTVVRAGTELQLLVDDAVLESSIAELGTAVGLDEALAGRRHPGFQVISPDRLVADLRAVRETVERAHPPHA